MSKDTPARPALDAMAEEIKRLTAIADAFPVRTIEPTDARLRPEWELKSYLRNNAPTIIRLLEAVEGMEKALEVPEVWSEAERDGLVAAYSKASAKHGHTESLFAVAAWLLRHRLATLRAAREMKP